MLLFYVYFILLAVMALILFIGLRIGIKFAPKKIKILSIFVFVSLLVRYSTLFILFFSKDIKYLFLLKPFFFLNLIFIPIAAAISFYIFSRNTKIKVDYLFGIMFILIFVYIIVMNIYSPRINIVKDYGYSMIFNEEYIYEVYIIINTIFFMLSVIFWERKNINGFGIKMILVSSILTIIGIILACRGINPLPESIIGDIAWVITLEYGLYKLKK